MKPDSIKGIRRKEVRKLIKERQALYDQQRALGYRKLEKPIRHGWYIELKLLPQLDRYKCKPEIEEIVEKLNRHYWGRTKEAAQKKWDSAESVHLIYRDIPTLSPKTYNKLSDKAKKFCTPFSYRIRNGIRKRYYVRIPKHAHKIKFNRAYTTHSKIIDPSIEERLDIIEQQLLKQGWYGIIDSFFPYKNRWSVADNIKNRKQTNIQLRAYKYASLTEFKNDPKWANRN
jgi:hypothetical protein